jgi:hypothetical protein
MAMHGLVSQFAPFDPVGVNSRLSFYRCNPQKGLILRLIPAPFTFGSGYYRSGAAAKGLIHHGYPDCVDHWIYYRGGGDIRNSRGELLYQTLPQKGLESFGLELTCECSQRDRCNGE